MPTDPIAPFLLLHHNGTVRLFADLRALARAVQHERITLSPYHVQWHTTQRGQRTLTWADWIGRDDLGLQLTPAMIAAALPARISWRNWQRGGRQRLPPVGKGLPVPYTGRPRYARYRRYPPCGQALRAWAATAGAKDPVAIKRPGAVSRDLWEGVRRNDVADRNWKRHRRTQWKARGGKP